MAPQAAAVWQALNINASIVDAPDAVVPSHSGANCEYKAPPPPNNFVKWSLLANVHLYFKPQHRALQAVIWSAAAVLSFLIVASRKHYTVDVLVAWYVVPLVFYASHRRWTTKRSLKEEWPHRPLPEEQPLELENIVVLNSAEVPPPLSLLPKVFSGLVGFINSLPWSRCMNSSSLPIVVIIPPTSVAAKRRCTDQR